MRIALTGWLAAGAAAAVVAACTGSYDGPTGSTGNAPHTLVSAAFAAQPDTGLDSLAFFAGTVFLVNTADSTQSFALTRSDQRYDILQLDSTISSAIGPISVPQGTYQLRVVIDSMRLKFHPPTSFSNNDSARTIVTPVGQRTGFNLAQTITLNTAHVTYVVNINPVRSVLFSGPNPLHPNTATLAPLMFEVSDTAATSVSGTVLPISAHATVYGISGTDTVAIGFADTTTGAFSLRLIPPGQITLHAMSTTATSLNVTKVITLTAGTDTTGMQLP